MVRRDHLANLDDETWLTDRQIRELNGSQSGMALWRWRHSRQVAFPMPDAVIGGRNYTRLGTFRAWRDRRLVAEAAARAAETADATD